MKSGVQAIGLTSTSVVPGSRRLSAPVALDAAVKTSTTSIQTIATPTPPINSKVAPISDLPESTNNLQRSTSSTTGAARSNYQGIVKMYSVKPQRIIVDLSLLILIWLPPLLFAAIGEPFERGFYCDDESIRYPYKESTVPNWLLYLVGNGLPIVLIVIIESYRVLKFDPQLYKTMSMEPVHQFRGKSVPVLVSNLYQYIGYFGFGGAVCQGLTDLAKYSVGRLRPHFYDVCMPAFNCSELAPYSYVIQPRCTTTDLVKLRDARLSFPSGHASYSLYAMVFLVIYIQARLIWPMVSLLVKHVLQNACIVLGVACALSRISDYKHHWSDVLAGVILGIFVACLTTFHMLGLFRQPHYIFASPSYLAVPRTDFSFGGDQFHNSTEVYHAEKRIKEQNVTLTELEDAKQVTLGILQHRNDGHIV